MRNSLLRYKHSVMLGNETQLFKILKFGVVITLNFILFYQQILCKFHVKKLLIVTIISKI